MLRACAPHTRIHAACQRSSLGWHMQRATTASVPAARHPGGRRLFQDGAWREGGRCTPCHRHGVVHYHEGPLTQYRGGMKRGVPRAGLLVWEEAERLIRTSTQGESKRLRTTSEQQDWIFMCLQGTVSESILSLPVESHRLSTDARWVTQGEACQHTHPPARRHLC
jgi:hypothetical protein